MDAFMQIREDLYRTALTEICKTALGFKDVK